MEFVKLYILNNYISYECYEIQKGYLYIFLHSFFPPFFFTNDFKIIAHLCLRTEENKTDKKKNENNFLAHYNYILG